jgi:hypothetical protein
MTIPISSGRRPRWRRALRWGVWLFLALVAAVALRCLWTFRDRNPGYSLKLDLRASSSPAPLRVGFARVKINPDLSDTNRPIWLAGFNQHRAATRIHDDLWAVACVIEDGPTRLGIASLDAIGFFHDDVAAVRRHLNPASKLTYSVVCATHNHSTPDLIGLWGPDYLHTGVDAGYRAQVIAATAKALDDAAAALQPARVAVHEIPTAPDGLVADTRKPQVFDPDIRVLHFTAPSNGPTIGSIVGWANHPETVWSKNTEITADFPGALRDTLENGAWEGGLMLRGGVGGMHLFVNGAVGGLMSTTPGTTVRDPFLQRDFSKPSHEKSRAVGRGLAARILPRLEDTNAPALAQLPISIRAHTLNVPLDNAGYLLASVLGLIDRGHAAWMKVRTEVALIRLGDVSIACVPGEIYPEIVNGGIETPEGGDFAGPPVETPPLRELMPGRVKFVFGLANDEIGYIIPRTQWDRARPYTYGYKHAPYGEINSCGPNVAPQLHRAFRELCRP